jgi:hypothetical protein
MPLCDSSLRLALRFGCLVAFTVVVGCGAAHEDRRANGGNLVGAEPSGDAAAPADDEAVSDPARTKESEADSGPQTKPADAGPVNARVDAAACMLNPAFQSGTTAACQACLQNKCCNNIDTCLDDDACKDLWACRLTSSPASCNANYPSKVMALDAMLDCVRVTCGGKCT